MFLKRHRLDVREAIELDEIDAIANLVRHGLGVALLPHTRHLDARGLRLLGWTTRSASPVRSASSCASRWGSRRWRNGWRNACGRR